MGAGDGPVDPTAVRSRLRLVTAAVIAALLVAIGAFAWSRAGHRAGTEQRVTLVSGQSDGVVWRDVWPTETWCLDLAQFPTPTGRWDDGIVHRGLTARGTLRFDTEDTARFFSVADLHDRSVTLHRATDGRGCKLA